METIQIRFNYVDNYAIKLGKELDSKKTEHRQFKVNDFRLSENRGYLSNFLYKQARIIAEKNDCNLQHASVIGGSDIRNNPIINYIFHGEKCIEACEELDNYYRSIILKKNGY